MDRFIVNAVDALSWIDSHLKSNMDRFIGKC